MTICLSMIVKNEAQCILKSLNSVKPFIDYWVICDTGSSDNTEAVIKDCLKDIPGELHNHNWENFSFNRNRALELAKNKADYTLILDADDYVMVNNINVFKNLSNEVYNIQLILSGLTYSRPQLIRNTIDYKYVGVIHEYLQFSSKEVPSLLPGCFIKCSRMGSRSQDPYKYLKDAKLLQNEIAIDPDNTRNYFYCAQSYRDANRPEEAIRYYLKRGEMTHGYNEERFCSYLEAGKLMERIRPEDFKSITTNYLKSHECNPNRVESLTYLAAYYRKQNLLSGSYLFAKMGITISKPYDVLFLEDECYDWKIHDELAVAGYWLGEYKEASEINERLILSGLVSPTHLPRITKNLEACRKMM